MSDWSAVKYISDITISVDGGHSSSTIYGNGRNCAAVTITFNGMNKDLINKTIDLRQIKVKPHVFLVDFHTGKELGMLFRPELPYGFTYTGLYYSHSSIYYSTKYCNVPTENNSKSSSSIRKRKAEITLYVCGMYNEDTKRMISVKIELSNGDLISTSEGSGIPEKVEIMIKKPIVYGPLDLLPIKWDLISKEGETTQQRVAFVKLKRDFKAGWIDYEFKKYKKCPGDLIKVSEITIKDKTYHYFFSKLGKQKMAKLYLDRHDILVEYNQEPEALCLICIEDSKHNFQDASDQGFVRLYDTYGNLAQFKLNYSNPTSPTLDHQNI